MNEKRIPISNKESNRIESNRICYFHDISLLFTCHVNVSLSKQRSTGERTYAFCVMLRIGFALVCIWFGSLLDLCVECSRSRDERPSRKKPVSKNPGFASDPGAKQAAAPSSLWIQSNKSGSLWRTSSSDVDAIFLDNLTNFG